MGGSHLELAELLIALRRSITELIVGANVHREVAAGDQRAHLRVELADREDLGAVERRSDPTSGSADQLTCVVNVVCSEVGSAILLGFFPTVFSNVRSPLTATTSSITAVVLYEIEIHRWGGGGGAVRRRRLLMGILPFGAPLLGRRVDIRKEEAGDKGRFADADFGSSASRLGAGASPMGSGRALALPWTSAAVWPRLPVKWWIARFFSRLLNKSRGNDRGECARKTRYPDLAMISSVFFAISSTVSRS